MSIKVFTAEAALASVIADPAKVLVVEQKRDNKAYRGTRFLMAHWNIGSDFKREGWFSVEDIEITRGVADPADIGDSRNAFEGVRLQLTSTVSLAGPFGEFLLRMNPVWREIVAKLIAAGTIDAEGRKIHDLLQTHVSKTSDRNPGAPIDDPFVRFKIDFSRFPQNYKHKFLVGQPRTQFFDYKTAYVDDRGMTQYLPATVADPTTGEQVPVVESNVHLFVTDGCVLRKGRIMMSSAVVSQSWISLPIHIGRAVIETQGNAGFTDEMTYARPPTTQLHDSLRVITELASHTADEIDDLLGGI